MNLQDFRIYDISPVISPDIAVFPGDTRYRASRLMDMKKGDGYTLSSMTSTVHLGAHADAPCHYRADGVSIEERSLRLYLGEAQVIEVHCAPGTRVEIKDLGRATIAAERILFKTLSFLDPNRWNGDFVALSPELVDFLAGKKVKLVGLDTPSVDLAGDKELLSHQRIAHHDMAVLEGLDLKAVNGGIYQLIALPLPLQGADASPVRAVLLERTEGGVNGKN